MSNPPLRVNSFIPFTQVEGPGNRACVWVQGCSIRCRGCFNSSTWPADGGTEIEAATLVDRILGQPGIEGVTFLGGEPFEQALALAALAERVQEAGLSVMTFTGFTLENLRDNPLPGTMRLLAATDLLVDGPYVAASPDRLRPWVGSTNQRFHALTDRYEAIIDSLPGIPDRLEVRLEADGRVLINGMASAQQIAAIAREVKSNRDVRIRADDEKGKVAVR